MIPGSIINSYGDIWIVTELGFEYVRGTICYPGSLFIANYDYYIYSSEISLLVSSIFNGEL